MSRRRPGAVVRPFVGHDLRAEQIPARHRRLAVALPHAGAARRGDPLREAVSLDTGIRGEDPDARGHLFEERRNRRRRPVGAAGRANSFLERLVPHAAPRDGIAGRFRREGRTHLPRVRIGAGDGLRRCPVVEPGAVAPHGGVHGAPQPVRGMAASGTVRARRRGVRTLPCGVPRTDPFGGDALHGDLQRLGGIFRHRRRCVARRHAADARLRHLLRVPRRRRGGAARRRAGGAEVCDAHFVVQRAVALRVGRRGGVHLDRSLPDSGRPGVRASSSTLSARRWSWKMPNGR